MRTINKLSKVRVLFLMLGASIFITSCCPDDDCETITCELPEPDPSEIIDLGVLENQTNELLSYDFADSGSDNEIVYSFEIEESLDYLITASDDVLLTLQDEDGNVLISRLGLLTNKSPYDFIPSGQDLPLDKKVFLEVKAGNNSENEGFLFLVIRDATGTDIELDEIQDSYQETYDMVIAQEPDDSKRVKFSVAYTTLNYQFTMDGELSITLYNDAGQIIGDAKQKNITGDVLEAGNYEIEIHNDTFYDYPSEGELVMLLNPNLDVDLGAIEPPYRESFAVSISDQEQDHKLVYSFSILDYASYFIHIADENVQLILKDNQGTTIASGNSFIANSFRNPDATNGERLEIGTTYYLEVIDTTGVGVHANLDITLRHVFETDVDLGILAVPSAGTYDFEIANGEPDKAIGVSFEIENAAVITLPGINNVKIDLLNGDGQSIDRAYDANETISLNLAAGEYRFDIKAVQFDPAIYEQLSITLTPQ